MHYVLIDMKSRIALSTWSDELTANYYRNLCTCKETICIEKRRKKYEPGDIVPTRRSE